MTFRYSILALILLFAGLTVGACTVCCDTPPAQVPQAADPGPGATCGTLTCNAVAPHNCVKVTCANEPDGTLGCEYLPRLSSVYPACRCVPGDKRPCGSGKVITCQSNGDSDTSWGACT